MVQLSKNDRLHIQQLLKAGHTVDSIARRKHCNRKTVMRWGSMRLPLNRRAKNSNQGRKRKMGPDQVKKLEKVLDRNRQAGSRQLVSQLDVPVSDRTVRRRAAELGFWWKLKPTPKPVLTALHSQRRLEWAQKHKSTDWRRWIFSDEKTFVVGGVLGQRVRTGEELVAESVKHPTKIHCWWAIGWNFKTKPFLFTDNLTGDKYLAILKHNQASLRSFIGTTGHFQQDGDPKHTAKKVKAWLGQTFPGWQHDWPPQSPDLNCIENAWALVDRAVKSRPPKTTHELKNAIRWACKHVAQTSLNNLINSMSSRIAAVDAAKGGRTKY